MGGHGPGGRAAGGGGGVVPTVLHWLGLHAEPVSLAVPASAGEVTARLYPVTTKHGSRFRLRLPEGGGFAPSAYVVVVPVTDTSCRVAGEIRPSRWAQWGYVVWAILLAPLTLTARSPWVAVAVGAAVVAVVYPFMLRAARAERDALRDLHARTVTPAL